ncbi:Cyanovirin-N [Diaporthe sp. PMI_573]|nr:Cyanovirin-N [Diaporthaceae sp. PMI_573]
MSNFHHTCEIPSIRVDHGHILRCRVAREDGEYVDSEIDLNSCIGNDNGHFSWGGHNFAETAEDIRFHIEGDNQPILRARLQSMEGDYEDRDINLTERIMNRDGCLCFEM